MSGLNSLFDDFDLSALFQERGVHELDEQGGLSSAQTSRASASAGASSGGGTRDAFEDLFGLGASTTSPTRAIPTGNVPSATPGAPPASDFFASPRVMGAAPGATPARPSADPFGGLGAGAVPHEDVEIIRARGS